MACASYINNAPITEKAKDRLQEVHNEIFSRAKKDQSFQVKKGKLFSPSILRRGALSFIDKINETYSKKLAGLTPTSFLTVNTLPLVKEDEILPHLSYPDDATRNVGIDYDIRERIFDGEESLGVKEVLNNIIENSKNPYFKKLATLLNTKITKGFDIRIDLKDVKVLKSETGDASGLYHSFYHSNKLFSEQKTPYIEIASKSLAVKSNLEVVILHEILHHLTYRIIREDSEVAKDWDKLFKYVKDTVKEKHYGLEDSDEFATELFTNSRFIETLKKYPASNLKKYDNLFTEILAFIKSLFKTSDTSLYDESFALLSNLIEKNFTEIRDIETQKSIEDEYYNQLEVPQFEDSITLEDEFYLNKSLYNHGSFEDYNKYRMLSQTTELVGSTNDSNDYQQYLEEQEMGDRNNFNFNCI